MGNYLLCKIDNNKKHQLFKLSMHQHNPECHTIGELIYYRYKTNIINVNNFFGNVQKCSHGLRMGKGLIKLRSLSMVKVCQRKPRERDRDGKSIVDPKNGTIC